MKISEERLLSDLNKLKEFTDTPDAGVTRFSYSRNDAKARAYIKEAAEAFGFSVRTDPIGNVLIGFADGNKDVEKICVGSHIDTVRNGGWLDGVYGVVSGLEVLRTLAENKSERLSDVEVVIFAEEEGSNFGSTMTGSKFIAGIYGEKDLDRLMTDEGMSLRERLLQCRFPPYHREDVIWDFSRVKAMLELHIEQGPVLEGEGKAIGIVDSIFGMTTIEVTIAGIGNHAGATPMQYRRDALTTAALCITEAERIARSDPEEILVATVGKVSVYPNCSNVIPEKVVFTLEVRHKRDEMIQEAINRIKASILKISDQKGTTCEIQTLAQSKPFQMDEHMITLIDKLAREAGVSHRVIDSGAVHDTCIIAQKVPSGMIFVPSKGGRSHVPFENTDPADLVRGAQLLFDVIYAV